MSIVKYKNQSGQVYAYEQTSYWDPVKQQSRPKRKCLGRVDPETGEIIKTENKSGRPKKKKEISETAENTAAIQELKDELTAIRTENEELKAKNQKLEKELAELKQDIAGIYKKTILE